MSLSWNEVRVRAADFAEEWKDETYEKGESQSFYQELFQVFGIKRRRVAVFERQVRKLNDKQGFIDVFWPGVLLAEQKSAGRDLSAARAQAEDYCAALSEKEHPRFILVCDFQTFELTDLDTGEEWDFPLSDLPKYVQAFGFMLGRQKRSFQEQPKANIEASELLGAVHDAMEASGYPDHELQRFLVRLLFCLFADDTGIFEPRGIFENYLKDRTEEDGSDLGSKLTHFFQVLDTRVEQRSASLDEDLAEFPYVNGELFAENLRIPSFDSAARKTLIEACEFGWEKVSPAIFGSLFQSVMDAKERRAKGAHYTSEKNIMKVIGPLFLDELHAEFKKLKALKRGRAGQLEAFRRSLGTFNFLDPACGCGNFLVIAYRELRELELQVLLELNPEGQLDLDAITLSTMDVDQFYGIELEEFPARIAEVAMWMTDHIANNRMSEKFGQVFTRIPLKKSPRIKCADALEMDWNDLLPAHQCSYVFGNPPFIGAKQQSAEQRLQVRDIARLGGSGGTLDYVAAWFLKAGDYVRDSKAAIAFVSTNSITHGEQVAQLFPLLFDRYNLEIAFAHRTFAWDSEARGKANVHVVVVGFTRKDNEPKEKRLFSYENVIADPEETNHAALSAYLTDIGDVADRHLVVRGAPKPINGAQRIRIGSKPIDGGYLIADHINDFDPESHSDDWPSFIRPYVGSEEYVDGTYRWIIAAQNVTPTELRRYPFVLERIKLTKDYRLGKIPHKERPNLVVKDGTSGRSLADTPTKFHVTVIPDQPFLILPETGSERRDYVPFGWMTPPTIPSNLVKVLEHPETWQFGVLTSLMHMAWLRQVGGRMKNDPRYSIGLVYNTFPWPAISPTTEKKIAALAHSVLDAREKFPDSTLADLYDPNLMPPVLRKAHQALDKAVDRLYRRKPFESERERVEHLFGLYEKIVAPVEVAAKAKPKRRRKAV